MRQCAAILLSIALYARLLVLCKNGIGLFYTITTLTAVEGEKVGVVE